MGPPIPIWPMAPPMAACNGLPPPIMAPIAGPAIAAAIGPALFMAFFAKPASLPKNSACASILASVSDNVAAWVSSLGMASDSGST